MTNYPINFHILAEDFRPQRFDNAPFSQDDAKWLLESLQTMCNAYDELSDEFEALREKHAVVVRYSVCYTPDAIRDSYDCYEDSDPLKVWVRQASDEQLVEVAEMIVSSDPTWRDFHRNIDSAVEYLRAHPVQEAK